MATRRSHHVLAQAANEKWFYSGLALGFILLIALAQAKAQSVTGPSSTMLRSWSVPMTHRLSNGSRDAVTFGTRTGATNGLDQGIDVLNPPPQPPPNNFDAYLEITHPLFPQLSEDYRSDQDSSITWKFVITNTANRNGTVRWNASDFPVGNPARAQLQIRQGQTVLANMLAIDSLQFAGDQTYQLVCFSTAKVAVETRLDEAGPESFSIKSYPNPFATTTILEISLPTSRAVVVRIFNLLGEEIRTFNHALNAPGILRFQWDGRNAQGALVPSGIYFCRLETRGGSIMRKLYRLR